LIAYTEITGRACTSKTLHWQGQKINDLERCDRLVRECVSCSHSLVIARLTRGTGSLTMILTQFTITTPGAGFKKIQVPLPVSKSKRYAVFRDERRATPQTHASDHAPLRSVHIYQAWWIAMRQSRRKALAWELYL